MTKTAPFPRPRRLRQAPWLRDMMAETRLSAADLVLPLFVQEGAGACTPVASLPGVSRFSIDLAIKQARTARDAGIPALALFPVTNPAHKTADGREALNPENLICRALGEIKAAVPEIGLIADVALDPYTTHGHDGVLNAKGEVENDATVEILAQQALRLAAAGADVVAPSDMMDGRVRAIRTALEAAGFTHTCILAYSAKYASAFYGPFRDAVGSAQAAPIDKRGYQMNPANALEALHEVALDVAEGADMVMVKPALPYLDVIYRVAAACKLPVLAYQVSGEYAAVQGNPAMLRECLLSIKRAGARAILTYGALDVL